MPIYICTSVFVSYTHTQNTRSFPYLSFLSLSVFVSYHLALSLPGFLYLRLSVFMSFCLSFCLSVCLPACLPARPPARPPPSQPICPLGNRVLTSVTMEKRFKKIDTRTLERPWINRSESTTELENGKISVN